MNARREIAIDEVVQQLRSLGVQRGAVLLVHTSFRAVRPIQGGPAGLITALQQAIGADGTLVMPSWTGSDDDVFDPATTPPSEDLGVVAGTFWQMAGVVRSRHPFAFAASGPQAAFVTSDPIALPPHAAESPIGRVYELDGQVLLLGVGHDADTTLHLGEILGGAPYRVPKSITIEKDGRPVRIEYGENDHCCQRFALADEWLRGRGLQADGQVGHAHARLVRACDVVAVTREYLAADPLVFLHPPDAGCEECDEARHSVARGA
jgi:aminoglycoside 3-N-acetyltransferase